MLDISAKYINTKYLIHRDGIHIADLCNHKQKYKERSLQRKSSQLHTQFIKLLNSENCIFHSGFKRTSS